MTIALVLSAEHGYSIAVAIWSAMVLTWASIGLGGARKKYKIRYPQMYAEQSDPNCVAFNCYQRSHQNVVENYPTFLMLLAISSIHRPKIAAVMGAIRVLGFIFYVKGYRTGNPAKRHRGVFGYIGLLGLTYLSCEVALKLILSK